LVNPYEEVLEAKSISRINPNDENTVYASSFFSGLLKIENDEPTTFCIIKVIVVWKP
jgi:hypothetical protein